jgi:hypothetical protein
VIVNPLISVIFIDDFMDKFGADIIRKPFFKNQNRTPARRGDEVEANGSVY